MSRQLRNRRTVEIYNDDEIELLTRNTDTITDSSNILTELEIAEDIGITTVK